MSQDANIKNQSITTNWKLKLESKNINDNIAALVDIVQNLNNRENDLKSRNCFCKALIESEICHFITELLIYRWQSITSLINKIVCHLSELEEFFKQDFYKIIRGYMRLINSFPLHEREIRFDYRNSIVSSALIIIKRARLYNADFSDKKKISSICLLLTAYTVCEANINYFLALDYINLILDTMSNIELDDSDKKFQHQKIVKIIQKINPQPDNLSNELCFILTSNVIYQMLKIVSHVNQSSEEKLIISIIIEKFMEIMEFVIDHNNSILNYECFCNLFYHLFTSEKISNEIKSLIANRFFQLNGHAIVIQAIKYGVVSFKSRVMFAETIFHFTKQFHNKKDDDVMIKELKPNFMDIAFNADFHYQDHKEQESEPNKETIMLVVIKEYINLKWKKYVRSKEEMLNMLAYFLDIIKRKKIEFDTGVFSMLISLYTSNFVNVQAEDKLIQTSSSTVLKYFKRFNVVIDLKFVQWWFQKSKVVSSVEYEKMILHFIKTSCEELDCLNNEDLYIFDLKYIIKNFINSQTPAKFSHNMAKVIARFSINSKDYEKIMKLYDEEMSNDDRQKSIDILEIMSINIVKVTKRLKKPTLIIARKILNTTNENIFERAMAIHLSTATIITMSCTLRAN